MAGFELTKSVKKNKMSVGALLHNKPGAEMLKLASVRPLDMSFFLSCLDSLQMY